MPPGILWGLSDPQVRSKITRVQIVCNRPDHIGVLRYALDQIVHGGAQVLRNLSPAHAQLKAMKQHTHQWFWYHETGYWQPYDFDQNFWIEEQWHAQPRPKVMKIDISGDVAGVTNNQRYCINFEAMQQFNVKTKTPRSVKRVPKQQQQSPVPTPAKPQPSVDHAYIETSLMPLTPVAVTSFPAPSAPSGKTVFTLHGFGQDPANTLAALKKAVLSHKKTATICLVS